MSMRVFDESPATESPGKHNCVALRCSRWVPDDQPMCGHHWIRVPRDIRVETLRAWDIDMTNVDVIARAVRAVAKKEGLME